MIVRSPYTSDMHSVIVQRISSRNKKKLFCGRVLAVWTLVCFPSKCIDLTHYYTIELHAYALQRHSQVSYLSNALRLCQSGNEVKFVWWKRMPIILAESTICQNKWKAHPQITAPYFHFLHRKYIFFSISVCSVTELRRATICDRGDWAIIFPMNHVVNLRRKLTVSLLVNISFFVGNNYNLGLKTRLEIWHVDRTT